MPRLRRLTTLRHYVSCSDSVRSTQLLSLTFAVPCDRLRQRPPRSQALSARLLMGSTPWWTSNAQNESIVATQPASRQAPRGAYVMGQVGLATRYPILAR
jgi:hypothetical protein